jgi:FemAB-related protein (PEP-CTERM system-associated)
MTIATMRVETFRGDGAEWDAFARTQPGFTHFHLAGWRDVVASVHGHRTPYLCARDESGKLRGVLPLVRVASPLFGRYLVSVPYVNYGGPLGDDEAVKLLTAAAVERGRAEPGTLVELRSRQPLPVELRVSHRKITCMLDVPEGGSPALWKSLDPNVRRRVRRAEKAGITLAFGLDQLGPFYDVYSRHMRDLGTPTQPRSLFEAIARRFPHDVTFGCAYLGKLPIATIAGLRWDNEFEVTWASALIEYKELAANMSLYWGFIERMAGAGVRHFNFGRCSPGSGTHRFKTQWGSRDEPLWWYACGEASRESTPSPTDKRYAWGPRLWKRLPPRMATAIGPYIVRFIP